MSPRIAPRVCYLCGAHGIVVQTKVQLLNGCNPGLVRSHMCKLNAQQGGLPFMCWSPSTGTPFPILSLVIESESPLLSFVHSVLSSLTWWTLLMSLVLSSRFMKFSTSHGSNQSDHFPNHVALSLLSCNRYSRNGLCLSSYRERTISITCWCNSCNSTTYG